MRLAVTALFLLRAGFIRVAAVVPCISGLIHVVRGFLVFARAHVTEPGLQGRGADRQDKDENQWFHICNLG